MGSRGQPHWYSTELLFNLILHGIGEVGGLMDMHLWTDGGMKIDVDVISTTSAPDLMALSHSLNGEDLQDLMCNELSD